MKKYLILGLLLVAQMVSASDEGVATIRASLATISADFQLDTIKPSQVTGMYEVMSGNNMLYVTSDGKYLFQGDIIDIKQGKNITEDRRVTLRMKAINDVGEDQMLIFSPKEPKYTITVFTDIDCGYCRKLHNEMATMNDLGIRVRYLFYPRSGLNTKSYYKAVSVWCAEDRQQAMTDSKANKYVARKDCDNPVQQHMEVGTIVGVSGTPTIVLEGGRVIPGYVPAKRLLSMLRQPF